MACVDVVLAVCRGPWAARETMSELVQCHATRWYAMALPRAVCRVPWTTLPLPASVCTRDHTQPRTRPHQAGRRLPAAARVGGGDDGVRGRRHVRAVSRAITPQWGDSSIAPARHVRVVSGAVALQWGDSSIAPARLHARRTTMGAYVQMRWPNLGKRPNQEALPLLLWNRGGADGGDESGVYVLHLPCLGATVSPAKVSPATASPA